MPLLIVLVVLLKWQWVVCMFNFVVTFTVLQWPLNDHEFLSINCPVVDVLKCTMKSFSKHWFEKLEFKIYIKYLLVYAMYCVKQGYTCARVHVWKWEDNLWGLVHLVFEAGSCAGYSRLLGSWSSIWFFLLLFIALPEECWYNTYVPLHLTFFILNPVWVLSNSGYQAFEASTFTYVDIYLFL